MERGFCGSALGVPPPQQEYFLHLLLKEQSTLINDYIIQRVTSAGNGSNGNGERPEDAVYTFICKKRLDRIERDIKRITRLPENGDLDLELRAG